MPYNEKLGARISEALANRVDVVEKKMFGGIAYMVRGNMCCGIVGDDLMVRVGPDSHDEALTRPHTRPMDFAGRPMKGMVYVSPAGIKTSKALAAWVDRGVKHALTLPHKKAGEKPKPRDRKK